MENFISETAYSFLVLRNIVKHFQDDCIIKTVWNARQSKYVGVKYRYYLATSVYLWWFFV